MNTLLQYEHNAEQERKRLQVLDEYQLFGGLPESHFDEIVALSAQLCGVPYALLNLVGQDQNWFKARYGVHHTSSPRKDSFCGQAILYEPILLVENAKTDPRFCNNPNVTGRNGIGFYAGVPIRNAEGLPIAVLCVFDTQPKQLNDTQIQSLYVLARQLLAQMELHKTVRQLNQLSRTLQEINRSKDRFFSIIAHDLRAAFHGILAFTDVLDTEYDDLQPKDIKQIANYLNLSSQATYKLLENLLSWARVENGSMRYKPTQIDLERLIDASVTALSLSAAQKNITLEFDTPLKLQMTGDINMLQSLLHNLVSNAIKFTHSDGKVQVRTTLNQNEVQIAVQDSGTGMSAEQVSQLFALEHSRSVKGTAGEKGTGLGLLLCKQFVEQHGGRIEVESELGKGSCFTVYLPVVEK